jgi:pimeloyl-ACP methyl ester carboxylesterase
MAYSIYYSESRGGDASQTPVLLIHGTGADHRSWPVVLRRLSGRRILAIDLPGHGHSTGRPRQSVAAYAQDLAAFLETLGIFRVVLVGHDLGAMVALQTAYEHPDRVAGLGLIAASAHLEAPPAIMEYFTNPLTTTLGWQWFQQMAFSPQTLPSRVETCLGLLRPTRPAVLAGDWQACTQLDLSHELNDIRCPAWVAYGLDDCLAPPASAHFLAARLHTTRLQLIPAAGHMVPFEQPDFVVEGLRAFLRDLSPFENQKVRVQDAGSRYPDRG